MGSTGMVLVQRQQQSAASLLLRCFRLICTHTTHLTREVPTVSYRNCFAPLQRVLFFAGQFFPFPLFAPPFPSAMVGFLFSIFESPPFRSLL
ncbi:unnamed protein product, partial [Citrullus colocynthis]